MLKRVLKKMIKNKVKNFLVYNLPDEDVSIDIFVKDEDIWISQKGMAELFDVNVPAISKHLNNIYDELELDREATVSKMEIVHAEGSGG